MSSLSVQHPLLHAATNNSRGGHRAFLDEKFDARLLYEKLRRLILQGLSTLDFDKLGHACRNINHCLRMLSTIRSLIPPSHPPRGSCSNSPQKTVRIKACQCHDHLDLRNINPYQAIMSYPQEHLVCQVCRRNWQDNIGRNPLSATPNITSRHDDWRVILATAYNPVCSLCDQVQKYLYASEGHDGCVCYREYYKKRWLGQRCDLQNGFNIDRDIQSFTNRRRNLRQVGNQMRVMPVVQGPARFPQFLSWCPCGRQVSGPQPAIIQTVPTPWPGNHNLIKPVRDQDTGVRRQITKQCVMCCGYIVPPVPAARSPARRSARLADRKSGKQKVRKHTMLGRSGKAATRHGVSDKGFEVRSRGGWS